MSPLLQHSKWLLLPVDKALSPQSGLKTLSHQERFPTYKSTVLAWSTSVCLSCHGLPDQLMHEFFVLQFLQPGMSFSLLSAYLFVYLLATLLGMWDLSSSTRDWTHVPCVEMKVAQSFPTLCDHMDYTVHEILHAGVLEWVVFPFSRGSSQPRDWTQVSSTAGRFFTRWATLMQNSMKVSQEIKIQLS